MNAGVWASFSHDPRVPAYAALRASDQDRNLIQQVLAEGYADGRLDREEFDTRSEQAAAARTLGQLPPLVADLVAGPDSDSPLARVTAEDLQGRAVAKYESDRREAFLGFLGPSLICLMIWFIIGHSAFFWPGFVMVGTGINLVRTLVQRQDMIDNNRRKLERKREKRLRELEAGETATGDDETDGPDEKDGSE